MSRTGRYFRGPASRVLVVINEHPEGITAVKIQRCTDMTVYEVTGHIKKLRGSGLIEPSDKVHGTPRLWRSSDIKV